MMLSRPDILALDVARVGMYAAPADGEPRAAAVGAAKLQGGVAVIPIMGMISHRERFSFFGVSSGASVERIRARLVQALADASVAVIVLYVDSPGGTVAGVAELASEIRAAREQKPVVAIVDTMGLSAAYWLASQATEIVVTPSGMVGSIGVLQAHENRAAQMEMMGRDITLLHAGKYKVEANPFEPLSDEARAALQESIDEAYAGFVAAVAAGRGVKASVVSGGFGEGRIVDARPALALGMVDRVETVATAIARIAANPSRIRRRAARADAGAEQKIVAADVLAALTGIAASKDDPDADQTEGAQPEPASEPAADPVRAENYMSVAASSARHRLNRARFA